MTKTWMPGRHGYPQRCWRGAAISHDEADTEQTFAPKTRQEMFHIGEPAEHTYL